MTVLSDRSIRKLCTPPETYFDQAAYDAEIAATDTSPMNPEPLIHYRTFGDAQAAAEKKVRERYARHTRPTTDEEKAAFRPMITPFNPHQTREVIHLHELVSNGHLMQKPGISRKLISHGTTSYGYDVMLTEKVKVFTNINNREIDPKRFDEQGCLVDAEIHTDVDGGRFVRIPPHSYILGVTHEYFDIPRDLMVVCLGKSTYARTGAIINTTPIEPGFQGNVVIEIANSTPLPMRIYLNEGIAQFLFLKGDEACETSYADRAGKYQGQTGVTMAKV